MSGRANLTPCANVTANFALGPTVRHNKPRPHKTRHSKHCPTPHCQTGQTSPYAPVSEIIDLDTRYSNVSTKCDDV